MPITVPTEQTAVAQPLSLPGAARADTTGAAVAAGALRDVASAGLDIAAFQQRRRNATKVFEAEVALDDAFRPVQQSARERRGSSAFGVTQDIQSWWEDAPSKITDTLENDTQRQLFQETVARRRSASLDSFSEFESREMNAGLNAAADASIATAINMGAAGFDNEATRNEAKSILVQRVVAKAVLNGFPADGPVTQAAKLEATTKLHQQVIENMVDVNPKGARDYFDANKNEIAGSVWDSLDNKINTANDIGSAQKLADTIWARGLSREDALSAARKESEGPVRESTLTLLRQQYAEKEQDIQKYQGERVDAAWAAFNQGGLAGLTPSMVADLQSFSPTTLETMRTRQWTPQDKVITDWPTFDQLREMARVDRSAFADTDLRQYGGKLNGRELAVLQKAQEDMRQERISPTATLEQMLGEVKWGKSDREEQGLFERRVREAVAGERYQKARELTNEETRQVIDRQLMEITVPRRWWFDKKVPLFEATADQRAAAIIEVDAIPQADRAQIEEALRNHGQPVTDENIVRLFRAVNGIQ